MLISPKSSHRLKWRGEGYFNPKHIKIWDGMLTFALEYKPKGEMMYCTINGHSRLERIRSGDKCVKWRQVGEMRPISDCLARRRDKSTDSFRSPLPIYKYHYRKWPIDKWSNLKTMHNIIWNFPMSSNHYSVMNLFMYKHDNNFHTIPFSWYWLWRTSNARGSLFYYMAGGAKMSRDQASTGSQDIPESKDILKIPIPGFFRDFRKTLNNCFQAFNPFRRP